MMNGHNRHDSHENEGGLIPIFNLNALTPRRLKEVRTISEKQTINYFNQRLDIERVTALTGDAIRGHVLVSQMADAATEMVPSSAKRIDALLGAHASYCYNKILDETDRGCR